MHSRIDPFDDLLVLLLDLCELGLEIFEPLFPVRVVEGGGLVFLGVENLLELLKLLVLFLKSVPSRKGLHFDFRNMENMLNSRRKQSERREKINCQL